VIIFIVPPDKSITKSGTKGFQSPIDEVEALKNRLKKISPKIGEQGN